VATIHVREVSEGTLTPEEAVERARTIAARSAVTADGVVAAIAEMREARLIVLDTSAMVEFLVGADELGEKVRATALGERLAAPRAVDLECSSAVRGLGRGRETACR
jgi:hypothetical protein